MRSRSRCMLKLTSSTYVGLFEELFNVKVVDVRTQNRLGKARRFRNRQGATRTWKKAIVKLAPDNRNDFF